MAMSEDDAGHRGIIKYFVERGLTPGQTMKEMILSQIHQNVSTVLIYKWHKHFLTGRTDKQRRDSERVGTDKNRSTTDCTKYFLGCGYK